jgi:hypothetical protein
VAGPHNVPGRIAAFTTVVVGFSAFLPQTARSDHLRDQDDHDHDRHDEQDPDKDPKRVGFGAREAHRSYKM